MLPSCPISTRRVDANMVRIISFQVALFTVILLLTHESIFAFILFFDFLMRTLRLSHMSLFALVAKLIITKWGIEPKLCDESPKRFALYMGLVISFILLLLLALNLTIMATFIAVLLFVCALIETLFDFCIGCKIYYAIQILNSYYKQRLS